MKTSIRNKKGFTIVELVIVIAVIAILAAVLIPTFANLVEKANLSADEQAVHQMNTALKIYEAENGKPEGISTVKTALGESGINANIEPVSDGYAFYWDSGDNVIELVASGETVESDWVLMSSTGYGTLVKVTDSQGIVNAINAATDNQPVLITLQNDISIDNVGSYVYTLESKKTVIVDLNNFNLSVTGNNTNGYSWFQVMAGCSLTIKNGTISGARAICARDKSTVSLEHVTINTPSDSAIFTEGFADVSVVNNCIITATGDTDKAYYAITNNSSNDSNDGSRIFIDNSTLTGTYAGIYIPTNSNTTIIDSKVTGYYWGAIFYGCRATLKNSTFSHTATSGTIGDLAFEAGQSDSGYATYGSYECENVTAESVYKYEPNGATVKITGISVEIKTLSKEA